MLCVFGVKVKMDIDIDTVSIGITVYCFCEPELNIYIGQHKKTFIQSCRGFSRGNFNGLFL